MMMTHGITHWNPDACFGCKIKTIDVAPSAMPTRCPGIGSRNRSEIKLGKDLAAYKRMRQSGLQPKATENAAFIESHAESAFEVESGQLAEKVAAKKHAQGKGLNRPQKKLAAEWRRRTEEAHAEVGPAMAKKRAEDMQRAREIGAIPHAS